MSQVIIENSEWRWVFVASTLLLITLSIPFMWAYAVAIPDLHFMGVLVNPVEGAAYQARMVQGADGSWLFHLPYTPEPHQGVLLSTFYLGLGHLARLLNLPLILVFHAARLLGGMSMSLMIYRFMADWTDDIAQRRIAWGLAVVGSGFGWVALLFDRVTPDLLIMPEAFPLQAAYANAHFPWAIAVGVWMAHALLTAALIETDSLPTLVDARTLGLALSTLMLVNTSPFLLLSIVVGYMVMCAWLWVCYRQIPRRELSWVGVILIFGLPPVAYESWVFTSANPIFHRWMQQSVVSPLPVWEYLVAFGPLLILSIIAIWGSRHIFHGGDIFLLSWLLITLISLYLPLCGRCNLTIGLLVPLAVYAGRGLWRVVAPLLPSRWRLVVVVLAFCTFIPTTVLAIVLPLVGTLDVAEGYPYYISREELDAFDWIESHTDEDALILASPQLSLYIPTRGRRVVYGHPFETLDPAHRAQAVLDFYSGTDCAVVDSEGVDYILVGPRERKLSVAGEMCHLSDLPVFRSPDGDVLIYAVHK